jgi:cytochrome c
MKTIEYSAVTVSAAVITLVLSFVGTSAIAQSQPTGTSDKMLSTGIIIPPMDAANGRLLFASKGCVVCHSVNGLGGEDAQMLGAEFMVQPMNPFDFAARMWRGAETMVQMQREELGNVIEMSGQELADIIAFVHDPEEQTKFSIADIPEDIQELMDHFEAEKLGVPHD